MSDRPVESSKKASMAAWAMWVVPYLAQVVTQRFMFADGSHFLSDIMSRHDFAEWDWPRQFAHYVTQGPVVMAVTLGLRDVKLLSFIYGSTLFAVPLVSLALCAWFTPKAQRAYLLIPAFAWAYIELNCGLFIISESHLAVACFWAMLFYVAFVDAERGGWAKAAAAMGVALVAMRVYESFLFLGPPLGALAAVRWREAGARTSPAVRTAFVVIMGSALVAASVGFYWMTFSDRNVHSVGLVRMVTDLISSPNVLASGLVFLWFALGLVRPRWVPAHITRGKLVAAAAVGFLAGLLPLLSTKFIPAELHYPARILTIVVPLCLTAAMLRWRQQGGVSMAFLSKTLLLPLCLMLAWNAFWQVSASVLWRRYADAFVQTTSQHRGLVHVRETALKDDIFNVPWTLPTLSILLPALEGQPIESLIYGETSWQPFDPAVPTELPALGDYHVVYAPALQPTPR